MWLASRLPDSFHQLLRAGTTDFSDALPSVQFPESVLRQAGITEFKHLPPPPIPVGLGSLGLQMTPRFPSWFHCAWRPVPWRGVWPVLEPQRSPGFTSTGKGFCAAADRFCLRGGIHLRSRLRFAWALDFLGCFPLSGWELAATRDLKGLSELTLCQWSATPSLPCSTCWAQLDPLLPTFFCQRSALCRQWS